jgi:hypothetical protein
VRRHEKKAVKAREEGLLRPLCVVLVPARLEQSPLRERVEDLLSAPGAVRVDPATFGYNTTARLPGRLPEAIAAGQAKRMPLPGEPRAIVAFDPRQYLLAGALLALYEGSELWYGGEDPPARWSKLHEAALKRTALRFGGEPEQDPHEQNRALWQRMEGLGIESGRLGSETARQ